MKLYITHAFYCSILFSLSKICIFFFSFNLSTIEYVRIFHIMLTFLLYWYDLYIMLLIFLLSICIIGLLWANYLHCWTHWLYFPLFPCFLVLVLEFILIDENGSPHILLPCPTLWSFSRRESISSSWKLWSLIILISIRVMIIIGILSLAIIEIIEQQVHLFFGLFLQMFGHSLIILYLKLNTMTINIALFIMCSRLL